MWAVRQKTKCAFKILGCIAIFPPQRLEDPCSSSANRREQVWTLSSFSVAPEAQGGGIGTKLLEMAIAETSKLAAGVGVVQKEARKRFYDGGERLHYEYDGKERLHAYQYNTATTKTHHARLRLCTAGKIGDERPVMTAARRLYDRMGFQPTGEVEHDPWGGMTQD